MELNHAFKQILILLTLGCPLKFDWNWSSGSGEQDLILKSQEF